MAGSKALFQNKASSGIAVADVQAVQKEVGKRKRYLDITGNWLNHPNDFLARLQAQVVFVALK